MGIVKISDELHEEIRRASAAMVRSINSQAEFWIKIGMLAETNPSLTYTQILREHLRATNTDVVIADAITAAAPVAKVTANGARAFDEEVAAYE